MLSTHGVTPVSMSGVCGDSIAHSLSISFSSPTGDTSGQSSHASGAWNYQPFAPSMSQSSFEETVRLLPVGKKTNETVSASGHPTHRSRCHPGGLISLPEQPRLPKLHEWLPNPKKPTQLHQEDLLTKPETIHEKEDNTIPADPPRNTKTFSPPNLLTRMSAFAPLVGQRRLPLAQIQEPTQNLRTNTKQLANSVSPHTQQAFSPANHQGFPASRA